MTHARRYRRLLEFCRRSAPVASAIVAVLLVSGPGSPVHSEDKPQVPQHDPAVLAEIARDVIRRAATGADRALPEPSSQVDVPDEPPIVAGAAASMPAPSHPGREGISVSAPSMASPPKVAPAASEAGYQSNSWRQAPRESARALSFSSGFFTTSAGLDPALKGEGARVRAEGRSFVYGFLLLRVPPADGKLKSALARLGVQLLGPHDDHQKARMPVESLESLAGLAEVEWIGVSLPEQKISLELAEVHASQTKGITAEHAAGIPIVINLFEADGDGSFRRQLEAAGAVIGEYDPALHFYRAVATAPIIDRIIALDFVLFVELIRPTSGAHDQSTSLVDADLIRPGGAFLPRFGGASSTLGILDTGFMLGSGAQVLHRDLSSKNGCGANFTTDAAGVWDDQHGHGTHVLATIAGTGTAASRYRGVATGVGSTNRIRAAKIWTSANTGNSAWTESAMDFMDAPDCGSPAPLVINMSGGTPGANQRGTDSTSRKLDEKVWANRQAYVISAGNNGPGAGTVGSPGVAKNALTVGNVLDNGHLTVGDIADDSSRGPTGDGRMKPNLSAPGNVVTSAQAGTTNQYISMSGTSMAAPHVTGLVATLMEHFPEFRSNPALLRAHMMSSAIAHDDVTAMSNDYGIGRVSGHLAHWSQPDAAGWSTHWSWGGVSDTNWHYRDITVPAGAQRLVVVLTWDEPAASAGASQAVIYDVDLYVDHLADCNEPTKGACGEWSSISSIDNVEYIVVNNPPAGTYRLKASNYRAPNFALPVGIAATIIHGDPTPTMTVSMTAPASVDGTSEWEVTATVSTSSYVASGVQVELTDYTSGAILSDSSTTRHDGVKMAFVGGALTLGNVFPGLSRSATWRFYAFSYGEKSFTVRAWSENAGTVTQSATTAVVEPLPDLSETAATTNPAAPFLLPGGTFSVSDTVRNGGTYASAASTTRYYLSLDGGKDAGDTMLTATRSVPALAIGASSSGTVTLTIPPATALNTYFLLACADDLNTEDESNEGNNCAVATSGAVTVTRSDLLETTASTTPAAPSRAPGTTLSVTDTVGNAGRVASGASTTRYYLSLDAVKSAGDTLLTGNRAVPGLASAATHSGTVTVTIPAATPLGNYYLLACADDLNTVVETSEGNNCAAATSGLVTVTRPDLIMSTVSTTPATPVRAPGTTFSVTDSTLNAGQVASGASTTRYYLSLNGTKDAGDTLLTGSRAVPGLAAGASSSGTVTVTIPAATPLNNYVLLACADDTNSVSETNEGNNCLAASGSATVMVTRPDLVETTATTTPAAPVRAPGTTFSVTDTARNAGGVASGGSATRYYLSLDGVKDAGDTLLTGSRSVPGLAAGATSAASVTVTIPTTTPLNTYVLLACADDLNGVVETNESNNCIVVSSGAVTVTRPDLFGDTVSNPPTTKARGTTFSVTDTTRNGGTVASGASTTRYYLSLDGLKNAGSTLLTGSRGVPGLAAGAGGSGTITVTIPSSTPLNTYVLLACADDLNTVVETTETNNCKASATGMIVTP